MIRPVFRCARAHTSLKFILTPVLKLWRWVLGLIVVASVPASAWACATCGCTVNADAVMGYTTESGWRVNVEYDYIDQDQLRSGTRSASAAEVVNAPSDP